MLRDAEAAAGGWGGSLRAVFEAHPDCMKVVAADGTLLDMNRAGLAMIGAPSLDQLRGRSVHDLVVAADLPLFLAAHRRALAGDAVAGLFSFRITAFDGQVHTVESCSVPLRDDDGGISAVLSVTRDVTAQRQAAMAVREDRIRHRSFLEINSATFWTASPDGIVTFDSDASEGRALSIAEESLLRPVHPDDLTRFGAAQAHSRHTGAPFNIQYRRRIDGTYRWAQARAFARRDEDGQVVRWYGTTEDIDDRKTAEARLIESEAFSRGIVESSADCIRVLDPNGRLLFMNQRGQEALEIDDIERVRGRDWRDLWPAAARPLLDAALDRARAGELGEFTALCPTAKGRDKWWNVQVTAVAGPAGNISSLLAISRDVTEHKLSEERIHWMATHDALTGLPNRTLFQRTAEAAFAVAERTGGKAALILLDVDQFKEINDDIGHDAGDAVLRAIAMRLGQLGSQVSLAARLGGDEFALLVEGMKDEDDLKPLIDALVERLHDPVASGGRIVATRGTFGVAIYPSHGRDYGELLKDADIALYMAKSLGRGGYALYAPMMRRGLQQRVAVAQRVRQSLDADIAPFYQPKVRLSSGALDGFEALMRIRHPSGRMQSPSVIASAFQDNELAYLMSERMLDLVIADMRRWLDSGVAFGKVAINAGAPELRRGGFADGLLNRLSKAEISPWALDVEVTESVFLGRDADIVDDTLRDLSAAGVGIALDDFGTGYASLSHIKRFPVDTLKIDRSFVAGLGSSQVDEAIVRSLLALGRSLNLTIVGEGIETGAQAQLLASGGCDVGQGFLIGRAMASAKVPAFAARLAGRETGWLLSEGGGLVPAHRLRVAG